MNSFPNKNTFKPIVIHAISMPIQHESLHFFMHFKMTNLDFHHPNVSMYTLKKTGVSPFFSN